MLLSVVRWHLYTYRHGREKKNTSENETHASRDQLHLGQKLIQHWYQRNGQEEKEVCIMG